MLTEMLMMRMTNKGNNGPVLFFLTLLLKPWNAKGTMRRQVKTVDDRCPLIKQSGNR